MGKLLQQMIEAGLWDGDSDLDPTTNWGYLPAVLSAAMQQGYGVTLGTVGTGEPDRPYALVVDVLDWRVGERYEPRLCLELQMVPKRLCEALVFAAAARRLNANAHGGVVTPTGPFVVREE